MRAPKIRKPTQLEKSAYEAITGGKQYYGNYHKSCFHLHTPMSYDYKLLESWDEKQYQEATDEQLLALCVERHVIMPTVVLDDIRLDGPFEGFSSKKQLMSFLLLADSIATAKIEIVLVADHNSILGVEKLEKAMKWIHEIKKTPIYPTIMLGVEISCADRNHVVGMFPNTPKKIDKINTWISEHLISEEDGVFVTSIDTLEFIHSIGGIGYLAHINTLDILKSGTFSGGFKKKLFNSNMLKFVGLSDAEEIDRMAERIKPFRKEPIKFLLDNDSHNIDSVGKNCFWIKGGKRSYSMVAEALNDYDISVEFKLPDSSRKYIKGLYIKQDIGSFLQERNGNDFCVSFSNALNCLIGGRGTGKSSVLEMLEYVLSQKCNSERMLAFICKHSAALALYELDGVEYLFEVIMPKPRYGKGNILECFGGYRSDSYRNKLRFNKKDVSYHAATHYLQISKIIHEEDGWYIETMDHPEKIRDQFLDVKYSINDLVNTASGEEINRFIQDTILKNFELGDLPTVAVVRSKKTLINMLTELDDTLRSRADRVEQILQPFNQRMTDTLRVTYIQSGGDIYPDFEHLIFGYEGTKGWYKGKNIEKKDVISYIQQLYDLLGISEFFKAVAKQDALFALGTLALQDFKTEITMKMVEAGISPISSDEEEKILRGIFTEITKQNNLPHIRDIIQGFLLSNEKFSLEFNINNREGSSNQTIFQDVRELSLGQKVVAMLTFVLGYSEYSDDFRPLIIDQPEDNLDNQYIYKNLVAQLRKIKEKRQVIIATHNATIVTNAKADLVCEMQSDHVHGWIETMGYPSEERIKKKILNHLEGGVESFMHKIDTYRNVLPK